jgi:hypothetical protein
MVFVLYFFKVQNRNKGFLLKREQISQPVNEPTSNRTFEEAGTAVASKNSVMFSRTKKSKISSIVNNEYNSKQ